MGFQRFYPARFFPSCNSSTKISTERHRRNNSNLHARRRVCQNGGKFERFQKFFKKISTKSVKFSAIFSSSVKKTELMQPDPQGFSVFVALSGDSLKRFSRVLIGSRNSEYPWIFTVLGRDSKWLVVSQQFRKIIF